MRLMILMLALIAAAPARACCTIVVPSGIWFFNGSTGVGHARWTASGVFIVESVVRGDLRVNEAIPARIRPCQTAQVGELYLISRNCSNQECGLVWASGEDAANMSTYLERAHEETHGAVMKKAIAWSAGELSLAEFRDWVETVLVASPSPGDRAFTMTLVDDLSELAAHVAEMPQEAMAALDLSEFVKLARAFPAGTTAEAFDDAVDAAQEAANNEIELPYRGDYETDLLAAVEKARDALRQRFLTKR